jgi:hypothetical protein
MLGVLGKAGVFTHITLGNTTRVGTEFDTGKTRTKTITATSQTNLACVLLEFGIRRQIVNSLISSTINVYKTKVESIETLIYKIYNKGGFHSLSYNKILQNPVNITNLPLEFNLRTRNLENVHLITKFALHSNNLEFQSLQIWSARLTLYY